MGKNITSTFVTGTEHGTSILLSGVKGRSLDMTISGISGASSARLDAGSVAMLHTFLTEFLQREETTPSYPLFEKTGRAVAVMDGDTLDIVRIFRLADHDWAEGAESGTYESVCAMLDSLGDQLIPANKVLIFFDTFDGCLTLGTLRRILRACVAYQVDFVRTGDVTRCRRMILDDIEAFTTIDKSTLSRATQDVVVMSPVGTFTMKAADASLERPSLFDEGAARTDGSICSRKEVLKVVSDIFNSEDRRHPYVDETASEMLRDMGYEVARRTVAKYRSLLGIPSTFERRAA